MSYENSNEIAGTDYFSLFSDGTIGCSDGVGYVGSIGRQEAFVFVHKAAIFFGMISATDDGKIVSTKE